MATAEEVTRSANILGLILKDPNKVQQVQSDPDSIGALVQEAVEEADKLNDVSRKDDQARLDGKVYKIAIVILGVAILLTIVGGVANSLLVTWGVIGKSAEEAAKFQGVSGVPESLVAIASTAVGALAGLLAPLGGRR